MPKDQGFLINANRIRVSRDLRGSREADPMEETVKIPLLSPGVKRGRRSDTAAD